MNKIRNAFLLCLFGFVFISCSDIVSRNNVNGVEETDAAIEDIASLQKGSAFVKLFVPDYKAISEEGVERIVAPQTEKVCFSYSIENKWYSLPSKNLSEFTYEVPQKGLKGKIYNIKVEGIPARKYAAGEIKVQLRDSHNAVITEDTNANPVNITSSSNTQNAETVTFHTVPTESNNQNGSLEKGEMKFWKVKAKANRNYTLTLYALEKYIGFKDGNGNDKYTYDPYLVDYNVKDFPDIVIFNGDGSFNKYYNTTAENNQIVIDKTNDDRDFYIGVWSPESDVYAYSLGFAADDGANSDWTGGFDIVDGRFGPEWNEIDNHWNVGTQIYDWYSYDGIMSEEKKLIVTLCPQNIHDGIDILSRPVIVDSDSILSFSYWGDSCPIYNGIVEFYVDGKKFMTFPDKQLSWKEVRVPLSAGRHNIMWLTKGISVWDAYGRYGKYEICDLALTKVASDPVIPEEPIEPEEPEPTVESVTIGNKTYKGYISSSGNSITNTKFATFDFVKGVPDKRIVQADGFFRLKGTVTEGSICVYVMKKNDEKNMYTYYIFDEGDFDENIWLRFGEGDYSINIFDAEVMRFKLLDSQYKPDFKGLATATNGGYVSLAVKNVAEDSMEDAMWTMPSYLCQSGSEEIKSAAADIQKTILPDASERDRLRAIHDWIINRTDYDNDSIKDKDKNGEAERKAQDAISVYEYKLGVCEGYANLFIALARYFGFKARYVSSAEMCHGWANVFIDGEWKLVDVTWDDPLGAWEGYYCDNYFLVGLDGVNNDHYGYADELGDYPYAARTVTYPTYGLDGWY